MARNYILNEATALQKLERMAYEIVESNIDESKIILAAVEETGEAIAGTIAQTLQKIAPGMQVEHLVVSLDKKNPETITINGNTDVKNQVIILIDDVSNSGKTLIYAISAFLPHHPAKIQTLALVERTHKTFPIKTDYVGLSLATTLQEHISVETENGKVKGAFME